MAEEDCGRRGGGGVGNVGCVMAVVVVLLLLLGWVRGCCCVAKFDVEFDGIWRCGVLGRACPD